MQDQKLRSSALRGELRDEPNEVSSAKPNPASAGQKPSLFLNKKEGNNLPILSVLGVRAVLFFA